MQKFAFFFFSSCVVWMYVNYFFKMHEVLSLNTFSLSLRSLMLLKLYAGVLWGHGMRSACIHLRRLICLPIKQLFQSLIKRNNHSSVQIRHPNNFFFSPIRRKLLALPKECTALLTIRTNNKTRFKHGPWNSKTNLASRPGSALQHVKSSPEALRRIMSGQNIVLILWSTYKTFYCYWLPSFA